MPRSRSCLLLALTPVLLAAAAAAQTTPFGFPGMDGPVYTLTVHDGDLIAGGEFSTAGGQPASCVARWDGTGWQPLGAGLSGEQEYTDTWGGSILFPPRVNALAVYDGELVAGGIFNTAGAAPCSTIARWDGAAWQPLGGGIGAKVRLFGSGAYFYFPPEVDCLTVFDGQLIAGGIFREVGGDEANFIAAWDGAAWTPLGLGMAGGVPPRVLALAATDTSLAAVGDFFAADAFITGPVVTWDGAAWADLDPEGTDCPVQAIAFQGSRLIVGGCFTRAGEADARHVARWSGSAWVPMGEGVPNAVHCLQVYGGQLYAGAHRWDDGAWVNELQTDGPVHALALYRGRLVAGGDFTRIGERAALNIAGWPEPITAARLAAFTAERRDGGARLAWELALAGPDDGAPGCHVWREAGGAAPVRLTDVPLRGEIAGADAHYAFSDPQAPRDAAVYRLQQVADDGRTVWLGEAGLPAAGAVPGALLLAAYPNPFNPRTTLLIDLPAAGPARLTVHDARGALVAVLRDGPLPAGEQRVAWDGRDRRGRPVPSGVYFARLRADTGQRIFKLILAR